MALLPFVIVAACKSVDYPFELCMLFVIFSFFRIHEAFPLLMPFRIPSLLALSTFAALGWNMFLRQTITPCWPPQLVIFLFFFLHMTLGVPFAGDRPAAIAYWTGTYYKIALMVVAIAWLTREVKHFNRLIVGIVLAGLSVGCVAIVNKLSGVGLVEGTRVTIGRNIRSALGDPNDLSLVLLFPMAFATALAVTKGLPRRHKILGLFAIPVLAFAVIATQSRGGLLGCLAVWGFVANRYIKQKSIIVAAGVVGVIVLKFAAGISDRQSGGAAEAGVDESAMGRIHAWNAAWRMAMVHPLVGVGIDNFIQNYYFYSDYWDGVPHAVHSTWFVVIAEGGFPGIGLFLTMIVVTFRSAFQALKTVTDENAPATMRAMALALVAGLVGFCVSGTFLTQGFTWPIYIQVALVSALTRYREDFLAERSAQAAEAEAKAL
ncbi:MAG: oligosaccharide repeat unit polymerase [Hyphomicrobiales bacterium]|nr:oligosaccharide repeat unit polymerase [Hyphomicrobiales bacterium]